MCYVLVSLICLLITYTALLHAKIAESASPVPRVTCEIIRKLGGYIWGGVR